MPGGLIQLAAIGAADVYLTQDPQISFFKLIYRRHTEFSMIDYPIKMQNNPEFGATAVVQIKPLADLLNKITLVVNIGSPNVKFRDPTFGVIRKIFEHYGISLPYPPVYSDDKIVTYSDIFRLDCGIHTAITNAIISLNLNYEVKLKLLRNIKMTFDISSDIFIGKYIAIKSQLINHSSQHLVSSDAKIDDISGYLLLNHTASNLFVTDIASIALSKTSFVYKQNTPATTASLIKLFVDQMHEFVELTENNLDDFIALTSRKHLFISSELAQNKKKLNVDSLLQQISLHPDDATLRQALLEEQNLPLTLGNWNLAELVQSQFTAGYITLGPVYDHYTDEQYYDILETKIKQSSIKLPFSAVDINEINQLFNRYTVGENSFYDDKFDIYDGDTYTETNGYYLLDVELPMNIEDAINLDPTDASLIIINPYYLTSRQKRLGIAPFKLVRKWTQSVIYKHLDAKVPNMANGNDVIANITPFVYDVYTLTSINIGNKRFVGISDSASNVAHDLHNFLNAMRIDIADLEIDPSRYKLNNVQIETPKNITNKIFESLVDGIIFVDQKKLGHNFAELFPLTFVKKKVSDQTTEIIENTQHVSTQGLDASAATKEVTYKLAKYLIWSFYFENLFGEISADYLVNMLLSYMRINSAYEMSDVRFTFGDIVASNICDYEEDTMIEKFMPVYVEDPDPNDVFAGSVMRAGGSISKELEFYHNIGLLTTNIDLSVVDNTTTLLELVGDLIHDHIKMTSYNTTYSYYLSTKYLDTYKNMGLVEYINAVQHINVYITQNIANGIIASYVTLNKYIFMLWRNFVYDDVEILPNDVKTDNTYEISIDYISDPLVSSFGAEFSAAFMTKAKYYCGIDTNQRPHMFYYVGYNLKIDDATTFDKVIDKFVDENFVEMSLIDNIGSVNKWLNCGMVEKIDGQILKLRSAMRDLVYADSYVNLATPYVYWGDFNFYIQPAFQRIASDKSLPTLPYPKYGFVLNHLPFVLSWYLGRSMQSILDLYPTLDFDADNYIELTDPYLFDVFAAYDTESTAILSYMGTDVGALGNCPFHGQLDPIQAPVYDDYIKFNASPNDSSEIFTRCPVCMRTYGFQQLFIDMYDNCISTRSNETHIVDIDTITNSSNEAATAGIYKTCWLYRSEPIMHDDASETTFIKIIDYCTAKIGTIYLRYANMIAHLLQVDETTFEEIVTSLTPSDHSVLARYTNYVTYLRWLRTNEHGATFSGMIEQLVKIINMGTTNLSADEQRFEEMMTRTKLVKTELKPINEYTVVRNIGTNTIASGKMIRNIAVNADLTFVRYQLYSGNTKAYRYIQDHIVNTFNDYMNNILNVTNDLNFSIFTDIYSTVAHKVGNVMVGNTNQIDFYRLQQNSTTATFDDVSTVMLNHLRHAVIYYDTVRLRYENRKCLFKTITQSPNLQLNTSADTIKEYFASGIAQVNNFVTHYNNNNFAVNNLYDPDVWPIYYSDPTKNITNLDTSNKTQLRQCLSYNQLQNTIRLIGMKNKTIDISNYYNISLLFGSPIETSVLIYLTTVFNTNGYVRVLMGRAIDNNYSIYGTISNSYPTAVDMLNNLLFDPIKVDSSGTITQYYAMPTSTPINMLKTAKEQNDISSYFHTTNLKMWIESIDVDVRQAKIADMLDLYQLMVNDYKQWVVDLTNVGTALNLMFNIIKQLLMYVHDASNEVIPVIWMHEKTFVGDNEVDFENKTNIETYDFMLNQLRKFIKNDFGKLTKLIDLSRFNESIHQISDEFTNYDIDITIPRGLYLGKTLYKKFIVQAQLDPDAVYIDSQMYKDITEILFRSTPKHAWVRYFGYRLIEWMELVADGQVLDRCDSDLLLLTHNLFETTEHMTGKNKMIGNIKEMFTIDQNEKPAMQLYIEFPLWLNRYTQSNLPLVNMLYSELTVKIKFRDFDELFYLEQDGILKQPVKFSCNLLTRFVYLGTEERKIFATTRIEQLMERFETSGKQTKTYDDVTDGNVMKHRLFFSDPSKYLLMRITIKDVNKHDATDKMYWHVSGYPQRDTNNVIQPDARADPVISRMKLEFEDTAREEWKEFGYYRSLQPISRNLKGLNNGEYMYSFSLNPRDFQPSGSNNFTEINNFTLHLEINDKIIELLKNKEIYMTMEVWNCSYNIFVTMSGFGALKFFGKTVL